MHGPDKNAITLMLGNSANGVNAFGANDYSADIRFNGSNVAWGDISYYPNGDGANGSFRFTRNGSTVATNGNAAIGCGAINAAGDVADSKGNLRNLPRNEPGSTSAYTAVPADKGKILSENSNVTFDNSATSTGNRTLASRGLCTLLCVEGSNNTFVISGALT